MTDYLISKGPIGEEDQEKWDGVNPTFTRDTSTGSSITLHKVGTSVDVMMVYGGGAILNSTSINLAISSIGSNPARIVLRQGSWVMNADITVPENITLEVAAGATITTTGYTLTVNGWLSAPPQKVFQGTGTVSLSDTVIVDPRWWGAVGDGSTDSTAAIQRAIDATAVGGTMAIPSAPSYFKITDELTIAHAMTIQGASKNYSRILQATAAKKALKVTGDYVTVKNLRLTGPGGGSLSTDSTAISVEGSSAASVAHEFVAEDCLIESWGDKGIYLIYVQTFTVKCCTFGSTYTAAIEMRSCSNGLVEGNIINTATLFGIIARRNNTDSLTTDPRTTFVNIIGNKVFNVPGGEGIHVEAGSSIDIDGNSTLNCNLGITVTYSVGTTSGVAFAPYYCKIVNNVVDSSVVDGSKDVGITLGGALASGGATVIEYGRNCCIIGNTVVGHGKESIAGTGAVVLYATASAIVQGNTIKDCGSNGIFLQPYNYDIVITGNAITNVFSNTADVGKAIGLHVSGDYNVFIASDLTIARRDARGTYELNTASGVGVFVANNANTSGKLGLVNGNYTTLLSDTGSKVSKNLN